ncbi:predicted protein [Thalassiosira pseudonana CCMP1335]|uniref:Uncharacterized protein n=1 Tax=Thalassiosira pseudonana TaxID=35128 RepID=B8C3B8_THAPS|nr:predicted protein [Thalassiosira pseudonana CCMP1335]EED92535.1 predicted protein [Thalassiosira pseudonana CCMP1335]
MASPSKSAAARSTGSSSNGGDERNRDSVASSNFYDLTADNNGHQQPTAEVSTTSSGGRQRGAVMDGGRSFPSNQPGQGSDVSNSKAAASVIGLVHDSPAAKGGVGKRATRRSPVKSTKTTQQTVQRGNDSRERIMGLLVAIVELTLLHLQCLAHNNHNNTFPCSRGDQTTNPKNQKMLPQSRMIYLILSTGYAITPREQ